MLLGIGASAMAELQAQIGALEPPETFDPCVVHVCPACSTDATLCARSGCIPSSSKPNVAMHANNG